MAEVKVNQNDLQILLLLAYEIPNTMTQADIHEVELSIHSASITKSIKKLLELGFVEKALNRPGYEALTISAEGLEYITKNTNYEKSLNVLPALNKHIGNATQALSAAEHVLWELKHQKIRSVRAQINAVLELGYDQKH